jgi:hypothetical protein
VTRLLLALAHDTAELAFGMAVHATHVSVVVELFIQKPE